MAHFGITRHWSKVDTHVRETMLMSALELQQAEQFIATVQQYFDAPKSMSYASITQMVPNTYRNKLSLPDYVGVNEQGSCVLISGRQVTARECYVRTILVQAAKLRFYNLLYYQNGSFVPAMEYI